jgi:uncharacterized protein (TIGR02145 family)
LPSDGEWITLINYAGIPSGTRLKAANGWNGTDDYGFSALPGGRGLANGNFSSVGFSGYWWNTTEQSASNAYIRYISGSNFTVSRDDNSKIDLYSVRCVKD